MRVTNKIWIVLVILIPNSPLNAQIGDFLWVNQSAGGVNSFAIDAEGSVYTIGHFSGTPDFDAGIGTFNLTSEGRSDAYIQKLDTNGNFLWAKQMGSVGFDYGRSVITDTQGNVYTMGIFRGRADFDPGEGVVSLLSRGDWDIFIQKFDIDGNLNWAKRMGGTGWDNGVSMVRDASGNIYTIGWFYGTSDFDPGPGTFNLTSAALGDAFIQKLDADGNLLWVKKISGTNKVEGLNISVDTNGNVYTSGLFKGTADFDPGSESFNLTATASQGDIFLSKLDAQGNFLWVKNIRGLDTNFGKIFMTLDANGSIYLTADFRGEIHIEFGNVQTNLHSNLGDDMVTLKIDNMGNLVWLRQVGGTLGFVRAGPLTTDINGNLYTTGGFAGEVDFDPGPETVNLTTGGGYIPHDENHIFIQKLDSSGNFISVNELSTNGWQTATSITVDAINTYITGTFTKATDFDPGPNVFTLFAQTGNGSFILKLGQADAEPDFLSSNGRADLCADERIIFYDHSSGSISDYSWSFGVGANPATATGAGPHEVFYTTTGLKNVALTVTGVLNGKVTETKDSFLNVVPIVNVSNAISSEETAVCQTAGTNVVVASADEGVFYQLFNADKNVSISSRVIGDGSDLSLNTRKLEETTNFSVKASSSRSGCSVALEDTVSVTVEGPFVKAFSIEQTTISAGDSVNVKVTNAEFGVSYQLVNLTDDSDIGHPVEGMGEDLIINTGTLCGTLSFSIRATNISLGCGKTFPGTLHIIVDPLPIPTITQSTSLDLETEQGFDSYQWYYYGERLTTQANSWFYTPFFRGAYTVKIFNGDCESISDVFRVIVTGLESMIDQELKVYPNPTRGIFKIEHDRLRGVSIYNLTGQLIYTQQIDFKESIIDLTNQSNGIYIMEVTVDDIAITKKITIKN